MKPKYTTMDLYGVEASEFTELLPILQHRKNLACEQLRRAMRDNFMLRDEHKILAINKAIEWNDRMIKEIKDEL